MCLQPTSSISDSPATRSFAALPLVPYKTMNVRTTTSCLDSARPRRMTPRRRRLKKRSNHSRNNHPIHNLSRQQQKQQQQSQLPRLRAAKRPLLPPPRRLRLPLNLAQDVAPLLWARPRYVVNCCDSPGRSAVIRSLIACCRCVRQNPRRLRTKSLSTTVTMAW